MIDLIYLVPIVVMNCRAWLSTRTYWTVGISHVVCGTHMSKLLLEPTWT